MFVSEVAGSACGLELACGWDKRVVCVIVGRIAGEGWCVKVGDERLGDA